MLVKYKEKMIWDVFSNWSHSKCSDVVGKGEIRDAVEFCKT